MRPFHTAGLLFLAGCLGGLTPFNVDGALTGTGATDTDGDPELPGGGGGGGGGDADTDTDSDSDVDTDPGPTTDDCSYPEVDVGAGDPVLGTTNPTFIAVDLVGIVLDDAIYDYHSTYFDADLPAFALFTFFDGTGLALCSVYYDVELVPMSPASWTTDSGGTLYEAWQFDLLPGSGDASDCTNFPAAAWGSNDPRDFLESETWGIGIGQLLGIEADVHQAVVTQGGNWVADWEPYVMGVYLSGGGVAHEVGYAFVFEHDCGLLVEDVSGSFTNVPAVSSAPVEGFIQTTAFYVVDPFAL